MKQHPSHPMIPVLTWLIIAVVFAVMAIGEVWLAGLIVLGLIGVHYIMRRPK